MEKRRRAMVAAVRRGTSMRQVAERLGVSLLTVQRWVQRAGNERLDRVDWHDRSHRPHTVCRTAPQIEAIVLAVRRELREQSDLGEYGARAIHDTLCERATWSVPAIRTIGRILERNGALDHHARIRRPPPPWGWYLPDVGARQVELDSFDVIEDLIIAGGVGVEVLTGISLHGGLPAAWPGPAVRAITVVDALIEHWRRNGLPHYAQFDNDTRFQGAHQYPDTIGRVSRLCLSLEVVPVFAPPRETGFQAMIESLNHQWQEKVWHRFQHANHAALAERSRRYIDALTLRRAARIEAAPARRPFPASWRLQLQARPHGRMVFLRRANAHGAVQVLGHTWPVAPHWPHRLVRAEVDLLMHEIRFYGLRRRSPDEQPLLHTTPYRFPKRRFIE